MCGTTHTALEWYMALQKLSHCLIDQLLKLAHKALVHTVAGHLPQHIIPQQFPRVQSECPRRITLLSCLFPAPYRAQKAFAQLPQAPLICISWQQQSKQVSLGSFCRKPGPPLY